MILKPLSKRNKGSGKVGRYKLHEVVIKASATGYYFEIFHEKANMKIRSMSFTDSLKEWPTEECAADAACDWIDTNKHVAQQMIAQQEQLERDREHRQDESYYLRNTYASECREPETKHHPQKSIGETRRVFLYNDGVVVMTRDNESSSHNPTVGPKMVVQFFDGPVERIDRSIHAPKE